ncbi:MAG TPA: hypothetical protein VFV10_18960 [Gammaproteobacteria bacterium]|nr:hypothetical protein [Gammaproteobacteria bacterium]
MSEQKSRSFRPPLYHDSEDRAARKGAEHEPRSAEPRPNDKQGWEAYRKWLTRVGGPKPASDRAPLDASIYSWKGYQNWADKVREAWKADES